MLKRFSLLTLLTLLFISLFSIEEASAKSLKDIPASSKTEINFLMDNGIITGYPDETFRPKTPVTRAEAAIMVGKAKKLSGIKGKTIFSDVPASHHASGYIQSANEAKIITGYPGGTFKPENNMSREDMAIIISKAFNFTKERDIYYNDVTKSDQKYKPINLISTAGISNGYPGGIFKPKSSITREEFAVMVSRAMNPPFKVEHKNEPVKQYVVTMTTPLNVRKGPGTSHASVGTLKNETEVLVHYKNDETWVHITSGNLKGYVHQGYLGNKPVPKPTPPKSNRVIALDAGHGGSDPGASGNGLIEKEINLDVSKRVETKLKNAGVKVVMTRTNDTYISLANRVNIGVNGGADTFVSIHTNSFGNASANGTESFYSTASINSRATESKKLAEFIQKRLVAALGTSNRGVKKEPKGGFHVLRDNPLPATLIELGFITNKSDADKLRSNAYKNSAATAITQGIIDYYNWKEK